MQLNDEQFKLSIKLGILFWIIAFCLVGLIGVDEEGEKTSLYIPMVISTWIVLFILLIYFVSNKYWPLINKENWVMELAIIGLILMAIQYVFDIILFGLILHENLWEYFFEESTVMIFYPSIIIQSILAGYIKIKKKNT